MKIEGEARDVKQTRQCIMQKFSKVVKNDICLDKTDTFLIFAQNIDCGYTLEPPQSMFWRKNKKKVYENRGLSQSPCIMQKFLKVVKKFF